MRIALVGAGNLATHLGQALFASGQEICQVYSRTLVSASALANLLECPATDKVEELVSDADLYVVALKDSAFDGLLPLLVEGRQNALWVHTAGSLPMSVWQNVGLSHYGVFYPMQTFSKACQVDFSRIPFFIEASGEAERKQLMELAGKLSSCVYEADSSQRRFLHLAAVFACNFTNAMYAVCERLLREQGIPFDVMLPLIDETARKVHELSPQQAQTGPAVRYDHNVMDKHLALLENTPLYHEVYKLLSRCIYESRQE